MKKWEIVPIVLWVFIIATASYFVSYHFSATKRSNSWKDGYESTNKLLDSTESELSENLPKLSVKETELENCKEDMQKISVELTGAKANDAECLECLKELRTRQCQSGLDVEPGDFNFSSNASISSSLEEIVGENYGKVINSDWDVVYNNAKTSIHRLDTKDYLFVFIVSFEGDIANNSNSIFWVGRMCLLDI